MDLPLLLRVSKLWMFSGFNINAPPVPRGLGDLFNIFRGSIFLAELNLEVFPPSFHSSSNYEPVQLRSRLRTAKHPQHSTLVNCSNCTLKTAFCAMNTSVYYHMCTTNCSIYGTVPCVVTFVCKTRDHGLFTEVHRVHMPRIGGE